MHLYYLESLLKVYPGTSSVGSTQSVAVLSTVRCVSEELKHVHESFFNFRCLRGVGEQHHKGIWTRKHVREATGLCNLKCLSLQIGQRAKAALNKRAESDPTAYGIANSGEHSILIFL